MQCVHIDQSSTNPIDLWFMSVIVVYHHNHCRRWQSSWQVVKQRQWFTLLDAARS